MKNLIANQSHYLQPQETHEYLRPQEVGPIIKRKLPTVWSYLRQGILPHIRIGGKYLIRRESLMQWLAQQEKGGI
jgi:excisionase family DNA binding protein